MKPTAISADELFEDRLAILRWQWIAGRNAPERRFDEEAVREAHSDANPSVMRSSPVLKALGGQVMGSTATPGRPRASAV